MPETITPEDWVYRFRRPWGRRWWAYPASDFEQARHRLLMRMAEDETIHHGEVVEPADAGGAVLLTAHVTDRRRS